MGFNTTAACAPDLQSISTLRHEFIDYNINKEVVEPLIDYMNVQKRVIEGLIYAKKEALVDKLSKLLIAQRLRPEK